MHCPSCGNESSLDQKFCRKCGFNLEPAGKLITSEPEKMDKVERERVMLRHMVRWMTIGLIIVGVAILMLITNKSFDFGKLFGLLTSFLMLTGVGTATYGVISAVAKTVSLSERKQVGIDRGKIENSVTTRELPDAGIPLAIPSVTEQTTKLFMESNRKPRE